MSYAEQSRTQKPGSMVAAIAVNGSIIAAIMLSPLVVKAPEKDPPTTAINVRQLDPPPDPVVQPDTEPRPLPPIYTPPRPYDYPIDKEQPQTSDDPSADPIGQIDGKGAGDIPGFDNKPLDPPKPIFRRATRDPRYASDFQPSYPSNLIVREIEGSATIRVLVGTDGRVREAVVVSASHPDFGKAAMRQALKAWRFKPATRDGQPVEDWQTVPVTFVLN
jgi:protein TonB